MINELCKAEIDLNDIITEERAKDLINRNFESLVEEIDKERNQVSKMADVKNNQQRKEVERTEQILIRVSKEERAKIDKLAKENDESVNKFVVKKIFGYTNYIYGE